MNLISLPVDKERIAEIRRRIFKIERLAAMPHVVWQIMEALGMNEQTPKKWPNS